MRHDLTSLQLFVAVAECANLTRAAEREHLAVSAVSKRIAELEAQAGTPLLQRYPRGVGLTPAGLALLRHARLVLRQLGELDAEMQAFAGGIRGHVRIHAVASALTQFLPEHIQSFLGLYPQVQVSIEERTGRAVVRAVAEGLADVGVVSARTARPGLMALPYQQDRLVLTLPVGHPLARRKRLNFAEVLGEAFVGPHEDSSLSELMTEAAQAAGRPLRMPVRASSFEAMIRLVSVGMGLALLPEGAVQRDRAAGGVKTVPLTDAWATRELVLVVRELELLEPISRTLMEHLQRSAGPA